MKIRANRDVCIGAGLCVTSAPAVFDQDDDGIVLLLAESPSDADEVAVRDAVALCPSGALELVEG